jgi:hypothetical protein
MGQATTAVRPRKSPAGAGPSLLISLPEEALSLPRRSGRAQGGVVVASMATRGALAAGGGAPESEKQSALTNVRQAHRTK